MTTQQMIEALMEYIADSYYDLVHTELDGEVYLHHVLIWMKDNIHITNCGVSKYGVINFIYTLGEIKNISILRELSKPLTEQSEETIHSIYSLIKK